MILCDSDRCRFLKMNVYIKHHVNGLFGAFQGLRDRVRPDHPGERRLHRSGRGESADLQLGVGFSGSVPTGDPAEALRVRAQSFLLPPQLLELVRTRQRSPCHTVFVPNDRRILGKVQH